MTPRTKWTRAALFVGFAMTVAGMWGGPAAATSASLAQVSPTTTAPTQRSSTQPSSTQPTSSPTTTTVGATANTSGWTTYHANAARTGALSVPGSGGQLRPAWTRRLGGAVYGQPLIFGTTVFAATENNRVVALNASTGRLKWSRSIGPPLTNVDSVAGCGDIDPLGITSTPVIDTATGTLYVVGEVSAPGGVVHHRLFGFNVATGAVTRSLDVDPAFPSGNSAVTLLQRAALALGNGRIYIGFGGNYGDCGTYHGWLVSVNETGPSDKASFEVATDGEGGAIWQGGGAPALDAAGDIYVTTGNANPDPPQGGPDPKHFTESVIKLSPTLVPLASFKDKVAGGDEDLSTTNPVLVNKGDLFAVGKTDIGYVLTQSHLAEVAAIKGVCGSDPDGGPAYDALTNRIFVPCRDGGIQVVNLGNDTLGPRISGANSGPILVGATLIAAQYPAGTLTLYDAASTKTVQRIEIGSSVPTFATPSATSGSVFIGTTDGVAAFRRAKAG